MFYLRRFNPEIHHRQSIRLKGWDYSSPGIYFITICTCDHGDLFGDVENGVMMLNEFGKIVEYTWYDLTNHNPHVILDAFVVMPDHIHGIIIIHGGPAGAGSKPAPGKCYPQPPNVGAGSKPAPGKCYPQPPNAGRVPNPPLVNVIPNRPMLGRVPNPPVVNVIPNRPMLGRVPNPPVVNVIPNRPMLGRVPNPPRGECYPQPPNVGAGSKPAPGECYPQPPNVGAGSKPAPGKCYPQPPTGAGRGPAPTEPVTVYHPLSEIVRQLKTFSARRINELRGTPRKPVWQRNFYESIIWSENALVRVRNYILRNPEKYC